jgi:antirestriction protein ArdC
LLPPRFASGSEVINIFYNFNSKEKKMSKTNDIYKQVTDSIIAALERGTKPWVRPWHKGIVCRPLRHNGVAYTGINIIMLWMRAELEGFHAPLKI